MGQMLSEMARSKKLSCLHMAEEDPDVDVKLFYIHQFS